MAFLGGKRKRPMSVLLHDGDAWHAYVFRLAGNEWVREAAFRHPSVNARRLPKEVLDFLTQNKARRVRILLPTEVHAMQAQIPDDADAEEIHTAVAFEAASEIDIDAQATRLAIVRSSVFRMGGERDHVLFASVDTKQLETYRDACEGVGLDFEAAGSSDLVMLGGHAREHEDARLMFLRRESGFYAVPATDVTPFHINSLPFGTDEEKDAKTRERSDKAARRLRSHRDLPMRVVSIEPVDEARRQRLREWARREDLEWVELPQMIESVLRHAVWAGIGTTEAGCAMVGMAPKQRDPHRFGTYFMVTIMLATLAYVGARWYLMREDIKAANERMAAWDALTKAREKGKVKADALLAQQREQVRILDTLTRTNPLPDGLPTLLATLFRAIPPYTRVEQIRQTEAGGFEIVGITRYQDGLPGLIQSLASDLRRHDLHVDPGKLEFDTERNVQAFTYRVVPKGGGT